jgi:hypothetical protein
MSQQSIKRMKAFDAADKAWSNELQKQFGGHAGDVRYRPQGRGTPNSELAKTYAAFARARDAWLNGLASKHAPDRGR